MSALKTRFWHLSVREALLVIALIAATSCWFWNNRQRRLADDEIVRLRAEVTKWAAERRESEQLELEAPLSHDREVAKAQLRDAQALADRVLPVVPTGWSLTAHNRMVLIKRDKPIDTYGTISLPDGDKEEQREYVRQIRCGRSLPLSEFVIYLWQDKRLVTCLAIFGQWILLI